MCSSLFIWNIKLQEQHTVKERNFISAVRYLFQIFYTKEVKNCINFKKTVHLFVKNCRNIKTIHIICVTRGKVEVYFESTISPFAREKTGKGIVKCRASIGDLPIAKSLVHHWYLAYVRELAFIFLYEKQSETDNHVHT